MIDDKQQTGKFKEAAGAVGCGDSREHFEDRASKLVKHNPVPERPE